VVEFPVTVWRYRIDLPVEGTDRQNLPDALEAEDLDLYRDMPREEVARALRAGRLRYDAAREEPAPAFAGDLATISAYLFQPVRGLEVAERYAAEGETDDVRAWKVVALRGEWVKVPLGVARDEEGRFVVDLEAEDLEVVRARWATYPRWFQDGMRRKHPALRAL
jgi:hypothetical protein